MQRHLNRSGIAVFTAVVLIAVVMTSSCSSSPGKANYVDPACGRGYILIGDTCEDVDNISDKDFQELRNRSEEERRCESLEAAGAELPPECSDSDSSSSAKADYVDPACGKGRILIGDICDDVDNISDEAFEQLRKRSDKERRCESFEAAGAELPPECTDSDS